MSHPSTASELPHPELKPGEKWLMNADYEDFLRVSWKTRRLGKTAYDTTGNVIPGLFPVFVQISETNPS